MSTQKEEGKDIKLTTNDNFTPSQFSKDFLSALKYRAALTQTENGAVALSTSFSHLLDLFGLIGALREREEQGIIDTFLPAYNENKELALKILFYARDIRGTQGLGERNTFRVILRHLAMNYPQDIEHLIPQIPFYGRWDDLLVLIGTPLQNAALDVIAAQYKADVSALTSGETNEISLLAKWLPSVNASSSKTRAFAAQVCHHLHTSHKEYRKTLSSLRAALRVTEKLMSSKQWDKIDYPTVPSRAALIYSAAFFRNDEERYSAYIESLARGETKINASTLYPYDIIAPYVHRFCGFNIDGETPEQLALLEQQWKALPDYLASAEASAQRYLVMADTSGSMFGGRTVPPIATSVGLALYFAERTTGYFANHFLTFSADPRLVEVPANLSLVDKIHTVLNDDYVGFSTDLDKAFALVLYTAMSNHVPQSELPTSILVISDMEIDECLENYDYYKTPPITFTDRWSQKFQDAGYTMPSIVYWNVASRHPTFHATQDDNVRFVSGHSASTFTTLCKTNGMSALETMLTTILDPRYDAIYIKK